MTEGPGMGPLSYFRSDDISNAGTESRSLPPAENELPLLSGFASSPITPTAALAFVVIVFILARARTPPDVG